MFLVGRYLHSSFSGCGYHWQDQQFLSIPKFPWECWKCHWSGTVADSPSTEAAWPVEGLQDSLHLLRHKITASCFCFAPHWTYIVQSLWSIHPEPDWGKNKIKHFISPGFANTVLWGLLSMLSVLLHNTINSWDINARWCYSRMSAKGFIFPHHFKLLWICKNIILLPIQMVTFLTYPRIFPTSCGEFVKPQGMVKIRIDQKFYLASLNSHL